jgi:hypothetical protein
VTIHGVVSRMVIRQNIFDGNDVGLSISAGYSSAESFTDMYVDGNRISNSPNMGIYANCLVRNIICNNLIYNNGTSISLSAGSGSGGADAITSGTLIANNVIYGPNSLIGLNLSSTGSSVTLNNNILHYTGTLTSKYCVWHGSTAGRLTSNNNVMYAPSTGVPCSLGGAGKTFAQWQAAGYDAAGVYANPLLTNPVGGNFTLQSSSPGLNKGVRLWQVPRDMGINRRTVPTDAGAYEQ